MSSEEITPKQTGIEVTTPTPLHKQAIKVDVNKLAQTVAKGSIDFFTGNWAAFGKDFVDLINAFGFKTNSPEDMAGLLIITSLTNAIQELVNNSDIFNTQPTNSKELTKKITDSLAKYDLVIDEKFFSHPENFPFLKDFQQVFYEWLKTVKLNENEAESLSNRLPQYFANALFTEWEKNQDKYKVILNQLDNPFTQAVEKQREWAYYRAYLLKQIQESVFQEVFSLKQIYIELRAFYEHKLNQKNNVNNDDSHQEKPLRIVVNPTDELNKWVKKADKDDAIRMITGTPGSGKSSFGKMWAATQAKKNKNVLFIPLHRFSFKDDVINSVQEFLIYPGFFSENPLEKTNQELNLLLIFDGLDELEKQGKIGEKTAKNFVDEVKRLVDNFNQDKTRLQVVILGREVVIQANGARLFDDYTEQLLYLLPYFLTEKEQREHEYIDLNKLLKEDQRQLWWQKYAQAKGKNYTGLPSELNRDNLIDITSQPLLNYLVVLSYEKGDIKFDENTNINQIYGDLLTRVYERSYEGKNRQHKVIKGIKFEEFQRILMEIAITCWHGNRRTTTIEQIENHFENNNLQPLLTKFTKSLESSETEKPQSSINNLLWAFYFRQGNDLPEKDKDKTFEFSHKSFGEYLTAIRIVTGLKTIHKELELSKKSYEQALIDWAKLTAVSPLDLDIFSFICHQMKLENLDDVKSWQKQLCKLIEYVMVKGMPMEALNLTSFKEMLEYSKNAESALLIVLNACARVINEGKKREELELSVIDWKSSTNFGEWISRLIGQKQDFEPLLITDCLSYLDLHQCDLIVRDFYRANLLGTNLAGANLVGANLVGVNFWGANLWEANLAVANLRGANLQDAILQNAILEVANLKGANLGGANLKGANLKGANLERTNLKWANLEATNLQNAILQGARLWATNLKRANFEGANLQYAHLGGANLEGANLKGANLEGTNINGTILKNTILEGKDIKEITGG